ncbi:hypothetical protein MASR2M50_09190 [Thauera sp.]
MKASLEGREAADGVVRVALDRGLEHRDAGVGLGVLGLEAVERGVRVVRAGAQRAEEEGVLLGVVALLGVGVEVMHHRLEQLVVRLQAAGARSRRSCGGWRG